jgi:hypothetical protein
MKDDALFFVDKVGASRGAPAAIGAPPPGWVGSLR